jgi:predicted glycosyltransferase
MTREAALLGVPTFSVFAGRTPAVDLALESRGALQRLCRPEQVAAVTARDREPVPLEEVRARGARIVKIFLEEVAKVELWTHSTTG